MRFCPISTGPIYFIGIGGIGMSGLADILYSMGYRVSGSDSGGGYNVERLRNKGIEVYNSHDIVNVPDDSVVVISSAITDDNPELKYARARGMPVVRRAEMLAEIMRLKPSIAVSGTHGKTTTTSMIATILSFADQDPTIISGGIINAYGTNARLGSGQWVVAEADESDGTFTKLPATIAVVTNIEPEHMEFYGTEERLYNAFLQFIENIPFYGAAILCCDDQGIKKLMPLITDRKLITYGFSKGADAVISMGKKSRDGMFFSISLSDRFSKAVSSYEGPRDIENIFLPMVGEHNVLNAVAAFLTALQIGITYDHIIKGLEAFEGVGRRFTYVGTTDDNICFIDDYAHHPTEIRAVLSSARSINEPGRVIAVIQPHRYSRLQAFFSDFVSSCDFADITIVTPVYSAGESPIEGINSDALHRSLKSTGKSAYLVADKEDLISTLERITASGDMVIFMGAGSISYWSREVFSKWRSVSNCAKIAANF